MIESGPAMYKTSTLEENQGNMFLERVGCRLEATRIVNKPSGYWYCKAHSTYRQIYQVKIKFGRCKMETNVLIFRLWAKLFWAR